MIQGLITSGAYCSPELQSEIGLLPPSFIPVGGKRLFERQHAVLSQVCDRIALTLPEGFEIPTPDLELLDALNIHRIFVPTGLSLAESLLFALNCLSLGAAPLRILHGDTLMTSLEPGPGDAWSMHLVSDGYQWAMFDRSAEADNDRLTDVNLTTTDQPQQEVLSGYFAIDDALFLCRCLMSSQGSFVEALNAYNDLRPLKKVSNSDWHDFGHLKTFFKSRQTMTTERAFNRLHIDDGIVEKTSGNAFKMLAERHWFESIPSALRLYTPAYLGPNDGAPTENGYRLAYEALMPLNELAVFGRLGRPAWDMIFSACNRFLGDCAEQARQVGAGPAQKARHMIELVPQKTADRLDAFARATNFPLEQDLTINGVPEPSVARILDETTPAFARMAARPSPAVMHGDFCFSNILFDGRGQRIKVVDPRGHIGAAETTIFGDQRYDVAKLFHSAIGRYDQIVSGYCSAARSAGTVFDFDLPDLGNSDNMVQAFLNASFRHVDQLSEDIVLLGVHLFLSMLPLHADAPERQRAFLCNAYRLRRFLDQPQVTGQTRPVRIHSLTTL